MIGKISIDIARDITRDLLSAERKAAFETNDLAIRDAQIAGDDEALAVALKRRDELRAIGDKIDKAKSLDALKAISVE